MDDTSDDALLAGLADVLARVAGPPPDLAERSRALYTWRTVDAELAELVHDSSADELTVGVRSGGQPRALSFETDRLLIEIELDDTPGNRRLIGQLVPAGPAQLELRTLDGAVSSGSADELGRFVLELPGRRGSASIRCTLPDGTMVETSWESM